MLFSALYHTRPRRKCKKNFCKILEFFPCDRRDRRPRQLNQQLCHRVQSTLANRLDSATPYCSLFPPPAALANVPVRNDFGIRCSKIVPAHGSLLKICPSRPNFQAGSPGGLPLRTQSPERAFLRCAAAFGKKKGYPSEEAYPFFFTAVRPIFQVLRMNFSPHLGQRILILPFLRGTRTICLHLGQRK